MYDGKKPELDMPYYGKQSRFFDFFKQCITPYLPVHGVYAETNSGSISNAYEFAKLGYKVIINDISEYSNAIACAVFNNTVPLNNGETCKYDWLREYKRSYVDRASIIASNMAINGYNALIPRENNEQLKEKALFYKNQLQLIRDKGVYAYKIFNDDLFVFLNKLANNGIVVDVMYMDFAWPWRDGTATKEYSTIVNTFSGVFNNRVLRVDMWDKYNVIDNMLKAINMAKKVSKYIFLSNQSSNFPTPEILEVALLENDVKYKERHTMLTRATEEDNLLNESFFREYLYVIEGNVSTD